jgi:uroporphyrinogen-III synthase
MITLGFTRPASKLKASVEEAEGLGFRVLAAPSLDIIHGDASEFARLKDSLGNGVPVIFGSTTAAEHCSQEFGDSFGTMMAPCEVIAIGPGTARRLEELGVRVDIVPEDHSSYGVLSLITERYKSGKIVAVRSDSGTDIISKGIADSGLELADIAVYKLVAADTGDEMIRLLKSAGDGTLDWMAFTSPLSASTFFDKMKEMFPEDHLERMRRIHVAAIGRPTADMLASIGREPDLIPSKTTFHDLLVEIRDQS